MSLSASHLGEALVLIRPQSVENETISKRSTKKIPKTKRKNGLLTQVRKQSATVDEKNVLVE